MIHLQKYKDKKEIIKCIELYANYNDNNFIAVDRKKSALKLEEKILQNHFFFLIKDEEEIVGWVLAEQLKHPFSSHTFLQQTFYMSNLNGIKSARAIVIVHEELIRIAELYKIDIVLTVGSFYDEKNVFTRILEKKGWSRRGHTAIWKTSHYKDK